jgi:hypothetical protein
MVKRRTPPPNTSVILQGTCAKLYSQKMDAFLKAFELTGSVSRACRIVGVARNMHYGEWMRLPEYREKFAEAKKAFGENLIGKATHEALHGFRQYKFGKDGKPLLHPITGEPYYEERPSIEMLKFLLKAEFPEKYGDKQTVEHTSGVTVTLSEAAVRQHMEREQSWLAKRMAAAAPGQEGQQPGQANGDIERQ